MNLIPAPQKIRIFSGKAAPSAVSTEEVDALLPEEGYRLVIGENEVRISGGSEAGLFYGRNTLKKIQRLNGGELPVLEIEDYPDFPMRGVLLAGAPNLETMLSMIPCLAEGGVNQLQIKIRENFMLSGHADVCRKAGVVWTPENLEILDRVCREHFMKLVPFINSCGHFEPFLERPEYRSLALCPNGQFTFPWGDVAENGTMLNLKDDALDFLFGMYEEILPCFSSDTVNIGCDETWELGGRYAEYCTFINRIAAWLKVRGKRCQIWGDIVLQSPGCIQLLDPEITVLVWGYNDGYPFERNLSRFRELDRPAAACPGTSAYLSICGRSNTARRNIEDAARAAHSVGGSGILNTDWQFMVRPWCTAFLPLAHGAAAAWNTGAAVKAGSMAEEANELFYRGRELALCRWIERFGRLSDILGTEIVVEDRSTLFCLYEHRFTPESLREYGIGQETMRLFFSELKSLRSELGEIPTVTREGAEAKKELMHALDLAGLGGFFALHLLGEKTPGAEALIGKVLREHAALWDQYHPKATLSNALQNLERMIQSYRLC